MAVEQMHHYSSEMDEISNHASAAANVRQCCSQTDTAANTRTALGNMAVGEQPAHRF
jgi:hypothetical protein